MEKIDANIVCIDGLFFLYNVNKKNSYLDVSEICIRLKQLHIIKKLLYNWVSEYRTNTKRYIR